MTDLHEVLQQLLDSVEHGSTGFTGELSSTIEHFMHQKLVLGSEEQIAFVAKGDIHFDGVVPGQAITIGLGSYHLLFQRELWGLCVHVHHSVLAHKLQVQFLGQKLQGVII